MKQFRSWFMIGLMALFLLPQALVYAQNSENESRGSETVNEVVEDLVVEEQEETQPLATISVNPEVGVGKAVIFDASVFSFPDDFECETVYTWDFGDGNSDQGIEAVHSYAETGEYDVRLTVELNGEVYAETLSSVFVYRKRFLLITDQKGEQEKIDSMVAFARDRGLFIRVISSFDPASEFLVEEDLIQKLNEAISVLRETDDVIVWTRGSTGLTVFSRLSQSFRDEAVFQDKHLMVITNQNFSTMGNIARGVIRTIDPDTMILTRPEALWVFLETESVDLFIQELLTRGIQYEVIAEELQLTPFNFMSYLVNYTVDKGVPSNSILLILMLPVIVTIVAFLKQVVGLTTMGVYTPSIITLSFLALDIKFGMLIFFVIIVLGTLTRLFLRRYRLLYIPRMAMVLIIVSLTILLMLFIGAYYNISQLVSISIFPMLIMSTMVEKFMNMQSSRGFSKALAMMGSTLFVATVCYYLAEWAFFKTMIYGHPEIIFVFLLINVFLGRWTGLRVLEYVRFREIFRYAEEEE